MDQPDCSFDLYNKDFWDREGYQNLIFYQNPLSQNHNNFGGEPAADQEQIVNEFREYYDKNDYENLNLLNWENEYFANDGLFNENWDIEFKRINELWGGEKSQLFDLSKETKFVNSCSKIQNDQVSMKLNNEWKEFIGENIIDNIKHVEVSTTTRKGSDSEVSKWDKTNLDSYSNETIDNYQKQIDEGSLIFLIRKFDRKTNKSVLLTKHRKKITKCKHTELEYYAKGMCKNCYHNKGSKSKKAFKCIHQDRDHYATGLCKNCYLHFFHIKKKLKLKSLSHYSNNQQ